MTERIQNTFRRVEYQLVLDKLEPVLHGHPPKIITIDGKVGSGKTSLGRFLSWTFNISLLETDLFLIVDQDEFIYRTEEVKSVIQHCVRGKSPRPIIVDGVCSLRLLRDIGLSSNFHIRVECSEDHGNELMEDLWRDYLSDTKLYSQKSFILHLSEEEESYVNFMDSKLG